MTARVLVVDDILSNVKLLEAKLTAEYFEVITAFNALECLAKMEAGAPDIVLLDVMMPGMDGGELAACFQANPNLKSVPVVFLTAAVTKEELRAGRGLVAGHAFLAKPVILLEVLACIKHHLGG